MEPPGDGIRPPQSWSELLPELAGLILRLLLCHIDRLRFSSVCRLWRLAAQQHRPHLPPALPFVCLNYTAFLSLPTGESRRAAAAPPAEGISCRGCFDGWFLYEPHDLYSDIDKCSLTNPISGVTIEMPLHLGAKFIVCSPDLVAAGCSDSVAFYRPGDPSWSVSPSNNGSRDYYVDFAFYRGKIYALNTADELSVHKAGGGAAVEHAIMSQGPKMCTGGDLDKNKLRCHYLVVSCTGKLLMVKWSVPPYHRRRPTTNFDGITVEVFEADLEKGRWLEVTSLDDGEALFLGRGCSKAVRFNGEDERFRGNCVYVLGYDNFFGYCCDAMPSYGFYDLRSGRIGQVLHDGMRVAAWPVISMEWFFPLE
ncbi:unnamed protein product [Urochloa decumbens]|uniref:KIB1-4 beta-propeller domain-containing protein n=1 Tax=Urochloa decumbens TaxID=240449 RepID=A0ABC8WD45_9POAL